MGMVNFGKPRPESSSVVNLNWRSHGVFMSDLQSSGVGVDDAQRLMSWKAIANYFDCDVRTARRWERDRALPVHRAPGGKRSAVFAYSGELDAWLQGAPREHPAHSDSDRTETGEENGRSTAPRTGSWSGTPEPETGRAAERLRIERGLGKRRTGRRAIVVACAAIALLMAVAGGVFAVVSGRRNPAIAQINGNIFEVMDRQGNVLWQKTFADGFWGEYYADGIASRIWMGDLEGKGKTDVLLMYHPGVDPNGHSTTLICYSDRGEEKWRWTPGRALPELEGLPPTYRIVGFGVLKGRSGEARRIVVSSVHVPMYPDQVAVLDSSGKLSSEYWHSGHLFYLTLADLDGNGREEIIASGISNGYHQATLIVLDPDQVHGASSEPARPEIQIHGMGAAAERLRLLFPRSDLNKALYTYNEGQDVTVGSAGIRFNVRECPQLSGCKILYAFDRKFHLASATAGDQFRDAHNEFYVNRADKHLFSPREEAEFENIRCLAGCESYGHSLTPSR